MIDADHEKELCRQLDVRMFPTVLFLSGDGTPLGRLTGKQPSHKLVIEMQSALQTIARRSDWSPNTFTR
jgi:thioredoxin-related protein